MRLRGVVFPGEVGHSKSAKLSPLTPGWSWSRVGHCDGGIGGSFLLGLWKKRKKKPKKCLESWNVEPYFVWLKQIGGWMLFFKLLVVCCWGWFWKIDVWYRCRIIRICIYAWNPNNLCFVWSLGPSFGGFKPQNRVQRGSRCYMYILYIIYPGSQPPKMIFLNPPLK